MFRLAGFNRLFSRLPQQVVLFERGLRLFLGRERVDGSSAAFGTSDPPPAFPAGLPVRDRIDGLAVFALVSAFGAHERRVERLLGIQFHTTQRELVRQSFDGGRVESKLFDLFRGVVRQQVDDFVA